jgi:hypothetical protein
MSKFFNALAVAVLGIALLMGAASAVAIDSADVSAEATEAFEIYLAEDADIPAAAPNFASSDAGDVGVNSNVNWELYVQGTDGGKMKHTTAAPDEIATNALKVSIKTVVDQVLTGAPAQIILDNQAYGGAIVNAATYKQTFTYDDLAGDYGIIVTWTIQKNT